ncbi:unnamed protein product [Heligmosomoides polygyrus]|uniref:Transthyretin-like family protein n=1 Tax=Heligmosomoides polygyrus TaxID=6339 RepID=A0A183FU23_HELPZ|nr:unnamed protein product [Heligmosomoides polygyrus]
MMRNISLALLLVPCCLAVFGFIGRDQSVAVTGHLTCDGMPASGVRVKLYEDEITIDSKLAENRTDASGQFLVSGGKIAVTDLDPKIDIYHKCDYDGPCYKKLVINIPGSYLTDGTVPRTTYDVGTINLANQFSGLTTDCIN